jgi:hypothetical protein
MQSIGNDSVFIKGKKMFSVLQISRPDTLILTTIAYIGYKDL